MGRHEPLYKIVRMYFNRPGRNRVIAENLTLEEAQAHCSDPETSSSTATSAKARATTRRNGPWFDGYEAMMSKPRRGHKPVQMTRFVHSPEELSRINNPKAECRDCGASVPRGRNVRLCDNCLESRRAD